MNKMKNDIIINEYLKNYYENNKDVILEKTKKMIKINIGCIILENCDKTF